MVVFYIQPGERAWYVLRDGQPTARRPSAHDALDLALLLVRCSNEHGEPAMFGGIATEVLNAPGSSSRRDAAALDNLPFAA